MSITMSFFKTNKVLLLGIGTGLFFGSGATILYFRLQKVARELGRLCELIARLETEFSSLKERLETTSGRKKRKRAFYSASSGDDDDDDDHDIFMDAYATSDSESLRNLVSFTSFPRVYGSNSHLDLFDKADELFEGDDSSQEEAYHLLLNNVEKYPANSEFHWRMSKACYLLSKIESGRGNQNKRKELLHNSMDHGSASLKLDQNSADANKWYAISLGNYGDFQSTNDKIKNGFLIKDHIQRAIDLKPNDASNHHMMGRWSYSVYMLSWLERKVAATLIASPPKAKIEDALEEFLTAEKLKPNVWKENMLYIAKSYIELAKYDDAAKWLHDANAIPVKTQDDVESQAEIEQLLPNYKR